MLVDEERYVIIEVENKRPFSVQVTLGIDAPDFKLKQSDPTFSIIPNGKSPWKLVIQAQKPCSPCDIAIDARADSSKLPSHLSKNVTRSKKRRKSK